MRFGIIGCGWVAERGHVPAMLGSDRVEIVATADPSAERARLLGGLAGLAEPDCHTDYRQLLDRDDVDVVSIATPPTVRQPIVEAAAAAGKHVIVEKPVAVTLDEAESMSAACDAAGVTFAVYHNYLYYPENLLARKLVADGSIGELRYSEFSGLGSRPWDGAAGFKPGWRYDHSTAGGGVVLDLGIHAFYLAEAFHGAPVESVGATMTFGNPGIDVATFCQLHLPNGDLSLVNLGWGEGKAGLDLYGTDGFISYLYEDGARAFARPAKALLVAAKDTTVVHEMTPDRPMFVPALYDDLVTAIETRDNSYECLATRGIQALKVALAAYKSANDGHRAITIK